MRISHNELMDEVRASIGLPPLGEDDVTVARMLDEGVGVSETTFRLFVKKKIKSGEWRVVMKRSANGMPIQTFVKVE